MKRMRTVLIALASATWCAACGARGDAASSTDPSASDAGIAAPDAPLWDAAADATLGTPGGLDGGGKAADTGSPPVKDAAMPSGDAGAPAVPKVPPTWTVLVYMASDNNLEKSGIKDIEEMMKVPDATHLRLIVEVDRAEELYTLGVGGLADWTGTKRVQVTSGAVTEVEDLGELNMGTAQTLADFIEWGVKTYPADKTMLVLWNHGQAWRGFGGDDASDDQLSAAEVVDGVKDGMAAAGLESFAMMGFDACLMADLVTVQAFQAFTRYLIVSEELEPAHGWSYQSFGALVDDPFMTEVDLGKAILKGYMQQAKKEKKNNGVTLSLLDLEQVPALVAAWEALIAHFSSSAGGSVTAVAAARSKVLSFGYSPSPEDDYNMVDMGDFASLLSTEDPAASPLAETLASTLDAMVLGLVAGKNTSAATGVSVYFPALDAYYEPAFDAIPGTESLRTLLVDFHQGAELLEVPKFQLADSSPGGIAGGVKAGCAPGGNVASSSALDEGDAALASQASLHIGFIGPDGQPQIVRRIPATVTATGEVSSSWDQHVLSVRQGPQSALVFAETELDEAYATHQIPLLYAGPSPCPCVFAGDPGYFDTDGDSVANCIDADQDGDGVPDKGGAEVTDNCPWVPNPKQADADGDSVGDACALSSNAPTLACEPDPANLFGPTRPAVLRVVTHRVQKVTESQSLYVHTPVGVSEVDPLPGMLYLPMVLQKVGPQGWTWAAGPPLPMRPDKGVEFAYEPLDTTLLMDDSGAPKVDAQGDAVTLKAEMGITDVYIELRVNNAAGIGDGAEWADSGAELADCEPQDPNWCADGQRLDCNATCQSEYALGNGVCDDGSDGADFNCQVFGFDGGDCQVPECPGAAGFIRDCNGNCYAKPEQIGDGVCHDGSNPALPKLSCDTFDFDGGDCPCGDGCSGHGTCVEGACQCTGGYSGQLCDVAPTCGNGACEAWESCKGCPADCGQCPDPCGDGVCKPGAGESCGTCPADCGPCACGDGFCSPGTEDCQSCAQDCGACPECGDQICASWHPGAPFTVSQGEDCASCPLDCGQCKGECCEPSDQPGGVWNPGGGCGDQAVAACVCSLDPSCCVFGWPTKCQEIAEKSCSLTCCVPDCTGKVCGLDGCGGLCGACGDGDACDAGQCVCDASQDADKDGLGDHCDPCPDDPGNDDEQDGVCAAADNCDLVPNPTQADLDGDGHGDACDTDDDADGIPDVSDNCPTQSNSAQADADGDGKGDACDPDLDGDGVPNATDNCPFAPNPDLSDLDSDGVGDACDGDDDGDTVHDDVDNCPMTPNPLQTDTDGDGKGDRCDDDDDGDGVADAADSCSLVPNPAQQDIDGDGQGDVCDSDDDGDSVEDDADNCPTTWNISQSDSDSDGVGDACDGG